MNALISDKPGTSGKEYGQFYKYMPESSKSPVSFLSHAEVGQAKI